MRLIAVSIPFIKKGLCNVSKLGRKKVFASSKVEIPLNANSLATVSSTAKFSINSETTSAE
jgi:hypothetical protein